MFQSLEAHSVGFRFWLELRKSFGILWTVGRWNALPLTPYFPYLYLDLKMAFFTFLEPNFLLTPRFVELQRFCDAPGVPADGAWLFLMEWGLYWSMQARDGFWGTRKSTLREDQQKSHIPALFQPHKCWGKQNVWRSQEILDLEFLT